MKKITAIFFTVILISILSACRNNAPPSLEDRVSEGSLVAQEEKSHTGVIEAFGVDIYQDGTHKIITDDDAQIVIQSRKVSLNNYIGKKVTITGSMQRLIDNKSEVFTVEKISLEGADGDSGLTEYSNRQSGFSFSYPVVWEFTEESRNITFRSNGAVWVKIEIMDSSYPDIDDFVGSKEAEDGAPVTIGGQRSLRYSEARQIRIYIPNTSKGKVYKITFSDNGGAESAEYKKLFYSFLESFTVLADKAKVGEKCGGADNIACPENYICEFDSPEEDAEGICVSVDKSEADRDCPYIPIPAGCMDYKARSFSRDGCPTSYECLDKPMESALPDKAEENIIASNPVTDTGSADDPPDASEVASLIADFKKRSSEVLPDGADISRFEIVQEQKLMAVTYSISGEKYRALYEYKPSPEGYIFAEKAMYKEGETRDWVLESGNDIKFLYDKKIVDTGTDAVPRVVLKDMRLYENSFKNFSLQYPASWYYRSFGAVNSTIWTVGFGNKPIDSVSDSVVTVVILAGAGNNEESLMGESYSVETARDAESHFLIKGPLSMKDTIDKMADTLAQK